VDKLITFPGTSETGEPLVFSLFLDDGPGMVKMARSVLSDPVQDYIRQISPTAGKLYVLVNALGAGEAYGSNLNGDWFEETQLDPKDFVNEKGHPNYYGYRTFYDAGTYRHHRNRDPGEQASRVDCQN